MRWRWKCGLGGALLAAAAAGCGGGTDVAGPPGDAGGEHLVLFITDRAQPGNLEVGLYDLDESGFRSLANLNNSAADVEPCLSEDGNFIVWASDRAGGSGSYDIYFYDRLLQERIALPGLNSGRSERWPRFTRGLQRLCFVHDSLGSARIRMYEPVGDTLIRLPGLGAAAGQNDEQPAPNETGDRIAFVSDRSGRREVHVWNRTAGTSSQPGALAADSTDDAPSLSRDGRWLAFASKRSGGAGGWDVYLYDLTANAFVALPGLNTAADERSPSVSNDGQRLVFASDRAGGAGGLDLYRYELTGGAVTQPTGFRGVAVDDMPYLRWR